MSSSSSSIPTSAIVLIGVLSEISAAVASCLGMGDAITQYALWSICAAVFPDVINSIPATHETGGDLHYVAVLLSTRAIWTFGLQVFLMRKEIKWHVLKYAAPILVVFGLLGAYCLDRFGDSTMVRWVLGISFSTFAVVHYVVASWRKRKQEAKKKKAENQNQNQIGEMKMEEPEDSPYPSPSGSPFFDDSAINIIKKNTSSSNSNVVVVEDALAFPQTAPTIDETKKKAEHHLDEKEKEDLFLQKVEKVMILAAIPSGFFGGAITVGAPPIAVVALLMNFPKKLVRWLIPVSLEIIWIVRNIYNVAVALNKDNSNITGDTGAESSLSFFQVYFAPDNLAMVSGGLVGVVIGNQIGKIIPEEIFVRLVAFLLFLAGLTLGQFVSAAVLVIIIVVYVMAEIVKHKFFSDDE